MRSRRARAPRLPGGARALAWCETTDGRVLAGDREALHVLPDGPRLPWEQVQAADWDRDASVLTVSEVGAWGEQRPVHRFALEAPDRLLELVRERVTATVLLQRHAPVRGVRGVRVIARRGPVGDRPISWIYEYDEGVDPDDPAVRRAARALLAEAHEELGLL